ncbi:putative Protein SHQ1 like protein [Blattamonas nauphoetae]|uniref:CS domain-containing protein n=1 Tax=Blattamonas nauphoetae TaxID=2049346 RepID=A0ABQ9XKP2_9EUKA|nr:putative Protein SHQ1 like protein [Blattamonas nauphoetae]
MSNSTSPPQSVHSPPSTAIPGDTDQSHTGTNQGIESSTEIPAATPSTNSLTSATSISRILNWEAIVSAFDLPHFTINNKFEFEYLLYFLQQLHHSKEEIAGIMSEHYPPFPLQSLLTINNHTCGGVFLEKENATTPIPEQRGLPNHQLHLWQNPQAQVALIDSFVASSLSSQPSVAQFTSLNLRLQAERNNSQHPDHHLKSYQILDDTIETGYYFNLIKPFGYASSSDLLSSQQESSADCYGVVELYRTLLAILHVPRHTSTPGSDFSHTSATILNLLRQAAMTSPLQFIEAIFLSQDTPVLHPDSNQISHFVPSASVPISFRLSSKQGALTIDSITLILTAIILSALKTQTFSNDSRVYLYKLPRWIVCDGPSNTEPTTPIFSLYPQLCSAVLLQMLYALPSTTPPPPSILPPNIASQNHTLYVPSSVSTVLVSLLLYPKITEQLYQLTPSKHSLYFDLIRASFPLLPELFVSQPLEIQIILDETVFASLFQRQLIDILKFKPDDVAGSFNFFIVQCLTIFQDKILQHLHKPLLPPISSPRTQSWESKNEEAIRDFDPTQLLSALPRQRDANVEQTASISHIVFDLCYTNFCDPLDLDFPFKAMIHPVVVKWFLRLLDCCYPWMPESSALAFSGLLQQFSNLREHPLTTIPSELVLAMRDKKQQRDQLRLAADNLSINLPSVSTLNLEAPPVSAFPLPPTDRHANLNPHSPLSEQNLDDTDSPVIFPGVQGSIVAEAEGLMTAYFTKQNNAKDFAQLLMNWKGNNEHRPISAPDGTLPISMSNASPHFQTYALIIQQLLNELNFIESYTDENLQLLSELYGNLLLENSLVKQDQDYIFASMLVMLNQPSGDRRFLFAFQILQVILPHVMDFPHFCVRLVQLDTVKSVQPLFIQSLEERLTRLSHRIAHEAQRYAQEHLDKLQELSKQQRTPSYNDGYAENRSPGQVTPETPHRRSDMPTNLPKQLAFPNPPRTVHSPDSTPLPYSAESMNLPNPTQFTSFVSQSTSLNHPPTHPHTDTQPLLGAAPRKIITPTPLASILDVEPVGVLYSTLRDRTVPVPPPLEITHLILTYNTLTENNITEKIDDLFQHILMEEQYFEFFAVYSVFIRIAREPRFVSLYANFLTNIKQFKIRKVIEKEVLTCTRVLLKAPMRGDRYAEGRHVPGQFFDVLEQQMLINFADFIGAYMIKQNRPIPSSYLNLKLALYAAFQRNRLTIVLPFVCTVIKYAPQSIVFSNLNQPWMMGILSAISDLRQIVLSQHLLAIVDDFSTIMSSSLTGKDAVTSSEFFYRYALPQTSLPLYSILYNYQQSNDFVPSSIEAAIKKRLVICESNPSFWMALSSFDPLYPLDQKDIQRLLHHYNTGTTAEPEFPPFHTPRIDRRLSDLFLSSYPKDHPNSLQFVDKHLHPYLASLPEPIHKPKFTMPKSMYKPNAIIHLQSMTEDAMQAAFENCFSFICEKTYRITVPVVLQTIYRDSAFGTWPEPLSFSRSSSLNDKIYRSINTHTPTDDQKKRLLTAPEAMHLLVMEQAEKMTALWAYSLSCQYLHTRPQTIIANKLSVFYPIIAESHPQIIDYLIRAVVDDYIYLMTEQVVLSVLTRLDPFIREQTNYRRYLNDQYGGVPDGVRADLERSMRKTIFFDPSRGRPYSMSLFEKEMIPTGTDWLGLTDTSKLVSHPASENATSPSSLHSKSHSELKRIIPTWPLSSSHRCLHLNIIPFSLIRAFYSPILRDRFGLLPTVPTVHWDKQSLDLDFIPPIRPSLPPIPSHSVPFVLKRSSFINFIRVMLKKASDIYTSWVSSFSMSVFELLIIISNYAALLTDRLLVEKECTMQRTITDATKMNAVEQIKRLIALFHEERAKGLTDIQESSAFRQLKDLVVPSLFASNMFSREHLQQSFGDLQRKLIETNEILNQVMKQMPRLIGKNLPHITNTLVKEATKNFTQMVKDMYPDLAQPPMPHPIYFEAIQMMIHHVETQVICDSVSNIVNILFCGPPPFISVFYAPPPFSLRYILNSGHAAPWPQSIPIKPQPFKNVFYRPLSSFLSEYDLSSRRSCLTSDWFYSHVPSEIPTDPERISRPPERRTDYSQIAASNLRRAIVEVVDDTLKLCVPDDEPEDTLREGSDIFPLINAALYANSELTPEEALLQHKLSQTRFLPSFLRMPSQLVFDSEGSHSILHEMLKNPDFKTGNDLSIILSCIPPSLEQFPYLARDLFYENLFEIIALFSSYNPSITRFVIESQVMSTILSTHQQTQIIAPDSPPLCSTLVFPNQLKAGSQPPPQYWPPCDANVPKANPLIVSLPMSHNHSTTFVNQMHIHFAYSLFLFFDRNYLGSKCVVSEYSFMLKQAWRSAFYFKPTGEPDETVPIHYFADTPKLFPDPRQVRPNSTQAYFNAVIMKSKEMTGITRSIPPVLDKPNPTQLYERVSVDLESKTAVIRPVIAVVIPEIHRNLIGLFDVLRSLICFVAEDPRNIRQDLLDANPGPRIQPQVISPKDPQFLSAFPYPLVSQHATIIPTATLMELAELFDLMSLIISDWITISPFIRSFATITPKAETPSIRLEGDLHKTDSFEIVEHGPFTSTQIEQSVAFFNLPPDQQPLLASLFKDQESLQIGNIMRQFDSILIRDFTDLVRQGHAILARYRPHVADLLTNRLVIADNYAYARVNMFRDTYRFREQIHAEYTRRMRQQWERLQIQFKETRQLLRIHQSKLDYEGFVTGYNNVVTRLFDPATKSKEMDIIIPWMETVKERFFALEVFDLSFLTLTRFTIDKLRSYTHEAKVLADTEERKKDASDKLTLYLLAYMTIFRLILNSHLVNILKTNLYQSYDENLSPHEDHTVRIVRSVLTNFVDFVASVSIGTKAQNQSDMDALIVIIPRVISVIAEELHKALHVEEHTVVRHTMLELDFSVNPGGEKRPFIVSAMKQWGLSSQRGPTQGASDPSGLRAPAPSFESFRADRVNAEVMTLIKSFLLMLLNPQHAFIFFHVLSSHPLICHLGLPFWIIQESSIPLADTPSPTLIQLHMDNRSWLLMIELLEQMIEQMKQQFARVITSFSEKNKIPPIQITPAQRQELMQEQYVSLIYRSLFWILRTLSENSPEFICVQSSRLLSITEFDPLGDIRTIITNTRSCKEVLFPSLPLDSWDAEIIGQVRNRQKDGEEAVEPDRRTVERTAIGFGCYVNVWYESVLRTYFKRINQMDLIENVHQLLQSKKGDILPFFSSDALIDPKKKELKDQIMVTIKDVGIVGHFVTYISFYSARGYQHFLIHEKSQALRQINQPTHILECPYALNSMLFIFMLWEDEHNPQSQSHIISSLVNLLTSPSAACTFAAYTIFFLLLRGNIQQMFEQDTTISRGQAATLMYPHLPVQPHSEQKAQFILQILSTQMKPSIHSLPTQLLHLMHLTHSQLFRLSREYTHHLDQMQMLHKDAICIYTTSQTRTKMKTCIPIRGSSTTYMTGHITPRFSCTQDNDFVTIVLRVPNAKGGEIEFSADDNEFTFYSRPYFLRLTFPGVLIQDQRAEGIFNWDTNEVTIKIAKLNPGEFFPDLEMLTKLLAQPRRGISLLGESNVPSDLNEGSAMIKEISDHSEELLDPFNCEFEQILPSDDPPPPQPNSLLRYGFDQNYSSVFADFGKASLEICQLQDPENTDLRDRITLQNQQEDDSFDPDTFSDDVVNEFQVFLHFQKNIQSGTLLSPEDQMEDESGMMTMFIDSTLFIPFWSPLNSVKQSPSLSDEERDVVIGLPKRVLLPLTHPNFVFHSLFDILFAFCYDQRVTCGEGNAESVWTITTLSSTLSFFTAFDSLRETVRHCLRRAIVFPLFRGPRFSMLVLNDVVSLFQTRTEEVPSKLSILRCLLNIKNLIDHDTTRYILSKIYINDYCSWIQQMPEEMLAQWTQSEQFKRAVDVDWIRDGDEIASGWHVPDIMQNDVE